MNAGHECRALARPSSDRQNLEGHDVEIVEGDLTDSSSLVRAVKNCDRLFHVAADYRLWTPDPQAMTEANVDGTRNIIRAAADAGVAKIIYTSSVATLGTGRENESIDETAAPNASSIIGAYKCSKFLAEELVHKMVAEDGFPIVVTNPSTPIGPNDIKPTPTGKIVVQAAKGKMPAYVDTGLNVVHVDDVAMGHLLAHDRGEIGDRYILGGENLSLKSILEEIAVLAGRRPPLFQVPHGVVLPIAYAAESIAKYVTGHEPFATVDGVRMSKKKMYFSSEKARTKLGYEPRPAVEALRDAYHWFQDHGYLR